jgi:hypothetical protein
MTPRWRAATAIDAPIAAKLNQTSPCEALAAPATEHCAEKRAAYFHSRMSTKRPAIAAAAAIAGETK